MRTVGIIAEYNPFHTGHEYHIQKSKELAQADYAVVVMSPDYVQRGEPAVFEKRVRAEMALKGGADLVIELPVCYAAGSAEYFAEGAVALLHALGVIDALCFGAEGTADASGRALTEKFLAVSSLLAEEPPQYQRMLQEKLRCGLSFPRAREEAVRALGCSGADLLSSPNNILGVEYCKALQRFDSPIAPLPLSRIGSGYSSTALGGSHCSAAALRRALREGYDREELLSYIPGACREMFLQESQLTVTADDFLAILTQKLISRDSFDDIADITPGLSDRIRRLRFSCVGRSFEEITSVLKSREMTEARIRRALLHLILDIRSGDLKSYRKSGPVYYAKVLGFSKSAEPLLHEIKRKGAVPLITKAAGAEEALTGDAVRMWRQDLKATHLYRGIADGKYHLPFCSEYGQSPVILDT